MEVETTENGLSEETTKPDTEEDEVSRMKRKRRLSNTTETTETTVTNGSCEHTSENDEATSTNGAHSPPPKQRFKFADAFALTHFSDEMLFEIFQYLDTWTLLALMNTCDRFHRLVLDHRFYVRIDLSQNPLPLGILEDLLERTHAGTVSVKIRGPSPVQHLQSEIMQFNKTLVNTFRTRCTGLRVLELEGITFDLHHLRISNFPKSLQRLMMRDCSVIMPTSMRCVFSGIDTHLKQLEEFGIERCDWFEAYCLMVFSKIPNLRWLSLQGCKHLGEFVPYGSMAARFGFKKLEYLDIRFTPLNDSDLQCFNAILTLKELRLDCPDDLRKEQNAENANNCERINATIAFSTESDVGEILAMPRFERAAPERLPVVPAAPAPAVAQASGGASSATSNDIPSTSRQAPPAASTTPAEQAKAESLADKLAAVRAAAASDAPTDNAANAISLSDDEKPSTSAQNRPPAEVSPAVATTPAQGDAESSQNIETPADQPPLQPNRPVGLANHIIGPPEPLDPANSPPVERVNLPQYNLPEGGDYYEVAPPEGTVRAPPAPQAPSPPRIGNVFLLHLNHDRGRRLRPPLPLRPNHALIGNHFGRVVNHPIFWEMLNPLEGDAEIRPAGEEGGAAGGPNAPRGNNASRCVYYSRVGSRYHNPISDRGICCFGMPNNPVIQGVVLIRLGNRPHDNSFTRLCVRNYKLVTDVALLHLVQCSPNLVYLDLSGTSVTHRGVERFKEQKPRCEVVAEHLTEVDADAIATADAPT